MERLRPWAQYCSFGKTVGVSPGLSQPQLGAGAGRASQVELTERMPRDREASAVQRATAYQDRAEAFHGLGYADQRLCGKRSYASVPTA